MPKLSFLILYTQACISTGSLTKQNTLWLIVPAEDGIFMMYEYVLLRNLSMGFDLITGKNIQSMNSFSALFNKVLVRSNTIFNPSKGS